MKKTLLISLALLGLVACAKKKPFESIKSGMSTTKVAELVGEPEQKMPILIAEWWVYPKDNKMIIMVNDTVSKVIIDLKAVQDSMQSVTGDLKNLETQIKTQLDSLK
ncbi:hypothetical protein [Pedobacter gandavensis]|uniref:Outer membrane protein assembly factor BamE n=1 Tax=Pedobacter gandavensis TaxID=2679963 RepID=A0ABR6F0U2_9SPHI|nr:hypothetical protein [Pedobacter gandavensis]MBB2150837.1 hypothetical protein [Pedobacter gandavensis]